MIELQKIYFTHKYNKTTYENLLNEFNRAFNYIKDKYEIAITPNSWIEEALEIIKRIIPLLKDTNNLNEYLQDNDFKWKVSTAITQLAEFNYIIKNLHLINIEDKNTVKNKLREIILMPLLVMDENFNTNQGRNSMFELRLAVKLAQVGYETSIGNPHPDIAVEANHCKYAIECKRIFTEKKILSNVKEAKKQLEKHSIGKITKRGIIAISITRVLNSGGTQKLSTNNLNDAISSIDLRIESLYKKYAEEIKRKLPYTIPAIILEISDIAEIHNITWIHKHYLIKTSEGSRKVLTDFKDFLTNQ